MKKYIKMLVSTPLFAQIKEENMSAILSCLCATGKKYKKNSVILMVDEHITSVGIVLAGMVQVVKEDALGNKTILSSLHAGDIFGETFVCADIQKSPVTVMSVTGCEILFVNYQKIVSTCPTACDFHRQLIRNMLGIIASKNLILNQKIEVISKRTTREKLMSYLSLQMEKSGTNPFEIKLTRQDMADFLCVDRSAMSRELSYLSESGKISFHGNNFELFL